MPYLIKCWILVDVETDEEEVYENLIDVEQDLYQMEMMQPENRYEIVECDKQGKEI